MKKLFQHIEKLLGKDLLGHKIAYGQLTVDVKRSSIVKTLKTLRDDPECQMLQLVDLCGVDYPDRAERFDVVYHLLSITQNTRVRIKTTVDENKTVPSVVTVFKSAGWYEREAWDLYGIKFDGNPDLRRLLTDYGFEGHPLRKDFPLTGFVEVRYDNDKKRVVYEPVQLNQDYRTFDFLSPWEGLDQLLPGDEKAS